MSKPKPAHVAPFNLPAEDFAALRELSARTRVSQAAYLREAVQDLLAKYRKPNQMRKPS